MKVSITNLVNIGMTLLLQMYSVTGLRAQSKYDSIDTAIRGFITEQKIPGFVACVVKDSAIVWSKIFGQADIKNNTPMSLDVIMNIGSISKTFTATAAMQLWEKGLLDLDADINRYLDFKISNQNFPDKPITISQILTHTSSIQDGKEYALSYACGDPTQSLKDWIYNNLNADGIYYAKANNFCNWAPGIKYRYSNLAFGLLGLIVERVANMPFNEYCREYIFKPLGMIHTGWFLSEIDKGKHVKPYAYVSVSNRDDLVENKKLYQAESEFKVGSYVENCLYSFPNYPDGLVRTSVRELSLYLSAMMNGGGLNGKNILNSETIDKMLSLQIKGNQSQGLCWHNLEFDSLSGHNTLWGHTGGDPGIAAYLFFNPLNKTGVITFQNSASGVTMEIVKKLYLASQ